MIRENDDLFDISMVILIHISILSVSSVQFSRSVVSDSLQPYESQNARFSCPSPTPGVYSNSCALAGCHPPISSSVIPLSSCPQSFPASGSFQMSHFFASGGWGIGVSASASVLPINILDLFLLGSTGWISLQSKGLSRVFSNTTVQNINSLVLSFLYSCVSSLLASYLPFYIQNYFHFYIISKLLFHQIMYMGVCTRYFWYNIVAFIFNLIHSYFHNKHDSIYDLIFTQL